MKIECDFLILGAGVTGLTIANEIISQRLGNVVVIEKEPRAGVHASGRNSGVLHAGIYYTPDSMKARFCIEGNRLMKEYCRKKGLKLRESGKVIITKSNEEIPALFELKRRADLSGARVEIIDEHRLREIEPFARTHEKALYSPETAVIDPEEILNSLVLDLTDSGRARIIFSAKFRRFKNSTVALTDGYEIKFKRFINAGGAFAERIAQQTGIAHNYRVLPFKGTYKILRKESSYLVRGNVYPVPDVSNPFLGVHFTRSVNDNVYVGPTAIPAFSRENYGIISGIDFESIKIISRFLFIFFRDKSFMKLGFQELKKYFVRFFYQDAKSLIPELKIEDILPSKKVGIRPQLIDIIERKLIMDFVILEDANSIHILNAISPAFTSSMAFAKMIVNRIVSGNKV